MLLAWILLAQDPVVIEKWHPDKALYRSAAEKCREAESLLRSSAAGAEKTLTAILGDAKIEEKFREKRLRIKITETEAATYDFYPYKFRGLARVRLAEDAAARDRKDLLRSAEQDFEKSVQLGHADSRPLLEDVRRRIRELPSGEKPDPLPRFLETLREHLQRRKYLTAKRHVEKDGAFLPTEERSTHLARIEMECREFLAAEWNRFLGAVAALRALDEITEGWLRTLTVPESEELVVPAPQLPWMRSLRTALARPELPALYEIAISGLAFGKPAFSAVETIAFWIARSGIESRIRSARAARRTPREALFEECRTTLQGWTDFGARAREAANPGLRAALEKLLQGFPIDAPIAPIVAAIERSVYDENPKAALAKVESDLQERIRDWDRYTFESRRDLARYRIVAASLRGFMDNLTPRQIADGLSEFRDRLKEVEDGGRPFDAYGPRVAEVFRLLLL